MALLPDENRHVFHLSFYPAIRISVGLSFTATLELTPSDRGPQAISLKSMRLLPTRVSIGYQHFLKANLGSELLQATQYHENL